jgi:hypothetical protein
MGTGWSFSKCYKCGGFALIRRTEINIIKVDKAPPGEKILLPEASIQPHEGLITSKATEKIARFQNQNTATSLEVTQPIPKTTPKSTSLPASGITDPNFNPVKRRKSHLIPVGITFATLVAFISGAYLLKQWSTHDHLLFSKTNPITVSRPALPTVPTPSIESVPTHPTTLSNTIQDPRIGANVAITPEIPKYSFSVTDLDDPEATPPSTSESQASQNQEHPLFLVKVRTNNAHVHSGPGMKYPVVKTITADTLYQVTHWNHRWFKISPTQDGSEGMILKNTSSELGWVRNDLVKVIHL